LLDNVTDKNKLSTINDYFSFCSRYLEYTKTKLQARIISQNENHYQFFQYREEGQFNITRPLNSKLMYDVENFMQAAKNFGSLLEQMHDGSPVEDNQRENIVRIIYTLQQSIGAALDGLPSGKSNQARKINGDLFERLIRLLVNNLGIDCVSGTVQVPVFDNNGRELFKSNYQRGLLLSKGNELKVIGSIKTSSKDRIDKILWINFSIAVLLTPRFHMLLFS